MEEIRNDVNDSVVSWFQRVKGISGFQVQGKVENLLNYTRETGKENVKDKITVRIAWKCQIGDLVIGLF